MLGFSFSNEMEEETKFHHKLAQSHQLTVNPIFYFVCAFTENNFSSAKSIKTCCCCDFIFSVTCALHEEKLRPNLPPTDTFNSTSANDVLHEWIVMPFSRSHLVRNMLHRLPPLSTTKAETESFVERRFSERTRAGQGRRWGRENINN